MKKMVEINKKNVIIKIVVLFILMFGISNKTFATTVDSDYSNYIIENYDIEINVNENNTFDITEKITVNFTTPKHGIIREIPIKNKIERPDGTKSNNIVEIKNISGTENFLTYIQNNNKIIKFGNSYDTITGIHTYGLKYNYNIGKDPLKNADEFYFNLIGNNWEVPIKNVSFKIKMPKSFENSLPDFFILNNNIFENATISYDVDGTVIIGKSEKYLNPYESLIIRIMLPEGYFVGTCLNFDMIPIYVMLFSVICLLIGDYIWTNFRNRDLDYQIRVYPPNNYNPLETAFLFFGEAENRHILSLLFFLANKGYLKIEKISKYSNINVEVKLTPEKMQIANLKIKELEDKIAKEKLVNINSPKIKILENSLEIYKNMDKPLEVELSKEDEKALNKISKESKENYKIIKLKDYDGNNEYEKIFFEGLFPPNTDKNIVNLSDFYNDFYVILNRIKIKINSKENKSKIYTSSFNMYKKTILVMIICIFTLITTITIKDFFQLIISTVENFLIISFPICGIFTMCLAILDKENCKILRILSGMACGIIPWGFCFLPQIIVYPMYIVAYIIGALIIFVLSMISINIEPKRTTYGNEMLKDIFGFRDFLESINQEGLKNMLINNPNYFYDIFPYAYVLEVSNSFFNKFKALDIQPPSWFSSKDFNVSEFTKLIDSIMKILHSSIINVNNNSTSSSSTGSRPSSGGSSSRSTSSGGGSGRWWWKILVIIIYK